MQVKLKSWLAAGLEQIWESAIFLPRWCKMAEGAHITLIYKIYKKATQLERLTAGLKRF